MQSTQRSVPLDVENAWWNPLGKWSKNVAFHGFSGQNRMVISWASHSHGKTSILPPPCNFQMTFVIFVNPFVGKFAKHQQEITCQQLDVCSLSSLFLRDYNIFMELLYTFCWKLPDVLRLSQLLPGHRGQTRAFPSNGDPLERFNRWWRW